MYVCGSHSSPLILLPSYGLALGGGIKDADPFGCDVLDDVIPSRSGSFFPPYVRTAGKEKVTC